MEVEIEIEIEIAYLLVALGWNRGLKIGQVRCGGIFLLERWCGL